MRRIYQRHIALCIRRRDDRAVGGEGERSDLDALRLHDLNFRGLALIVTCKIQTVIDTFHILFLISSPCDFLLRLKGIVGKVQFGKRQTVQTHCATSMSHSATMPAAVPHAASLNCKFTCFQYFRRLIHRLKN